MTGGRKAGTIGPMNRKTIGVVTAEESDMLDVLRQSKLRVRVFKPGTITKHALDSCFAVAIIGGTQEKPLVLHPAERVEVEAHIAKGAKVLSEYCESIGNLYCAPPASTRFERIVYCGEPGMIEGIDAGDMLDEQCNTRIAPYMEFGCSHKRPLFQYVNVPAHRRMEVADELPGREADRAIWFDEPETLLVCGFRLANFSKSRFAPLKKWRSLVQYMLEWLCEEPVSLDGLRESYHTGRSGSFEAALAASVHAAMSWFEGSETLLSGGKRGVCEGMGTEIYPDGRQKKVGTIRSDCMGETAFAYAMYYLLTKDGKYLDISDHLLKGCFDWFVLRDDDSPLDGMMRWTDTGWGVCYQDDAARVIIPQLLKNLYLGKTEHLELCCKTLDFLLRTTGTDGTRVFRTDNVYMTPEGMEALVSRPGKLPSAHYNGFYMAALLLAYRVTGNEAYRAAGVKGMETIMAHYPSTTREQSQTQELCRLILPLSWLYWVTGDWRHKDWLYRVSRDLQQFRHPSGAYLEWDEGYSASMYGTKPGEESSLLTQNGDPVVDLLYSLNWLPHAFMQAYFVTRDDYFKQMWKQISQFLVSVQIHSDNKQIDGGWTRAFDVELMEVYGYPGDGGWGPWAIESGWTVAEIAAGFIAGMLDDQLMQRYG